MAAVVFLVAAVGDRVLGTAGTALLERSQLRFSRLYRGDLSADVVILGNSRGVNTLSAPALSDQTGLRVRSLAWNGISAEIGEALWKDWLDRYPAPRLVLVEVSFLTGSNRQLSDFSPYFTVSPRLASLARRDIPHTYWACRVSRLFCLNSELTLRALAFARKSDQGWANQYTITPALLEETRHLPPQPMDSILPSDVEALRRILTSARAAGTRVRLIYGPYLPTYRQHLVDVPGWIAGVEQAVGAPVLDYSDAVSDPDLFSDRIHMNARGARVFATTLVRDGLLEVGR
jgi:hypothetical protein